MAYTTTQVIALTSSDGTTVLYFRPGAAHVSRRRIEKNQEVTTCESGRQVVTTLSDNEVEMTEITFSALQKDDETVDAMTMAGFDSLRDFVRDIANYRANLIKYKAKGRTLLQTDNLYLDQAELTDVIEYVDEDGDNVYGCKLTLRRVIEA